MNLDITSWGNFKISELFPILQNGKANQGMLSDGHDCFYVGAKKDDNGVMLHCAYDNALMQKGNCIIFICNGQGSVGYANYMDVDFIGSTDIVAGYNKMLNQYNGLFIATVLCQERPKYSFGRKWKTHLKDTVIKLPQTIEGLPDWDFMEQYIKSLDYKKVTTKIKNVNYKKIFVLEWKEFNISRFKNHPGLFCIENCKCGSASDLDDGLDINYIGAKKSDNGVMRKVALQQKLVSLGNGIMFICDGEGSVGYANYMDKSFIGSTTTSIGYDESLNKYNALFIVTILDKEKFKFSYGRKYRAHINEIQIKLPVKRNQDSTIYIDNTHKYSEEGYVPDWEYMENYIKSLPYGDRI